MSDVFRVTVRGRFVDLTPKAESFLRDNVEYHDLFSSAFTEEGTLAYDDKLLFFNLRYEVRDAHDAADAEAFATAEATTFLDVIGLGHRLGRVTSMNMSDMTRRP